MVATPDAVDAAQELKSNGIRAIAKVDNGNAEVEIRGYRHTIPGEVCRFAGNRFGFTLIRTHDDRLVLR